MPYSLTSMNPSAKADNVQPLLIAIVDDDACVRATVARVVRGHNVVQFDDARELLERVLAGARFDLIVSDLMMPNLTGAGLYAELSRVAPAQAARMVVVTGGATTQAAVAFLASDMVPIIEKPFDPAKLLAVVERVGRARRAE